MLLSGSMTSAGAPSTCHHAPLPHVHQLLVELPVRQLVLIQQPLGQLMVVRVQESRVVVEDVWLEHTGVDVRILVEGLNLLQHRRQPVHVGRHELRGGPPQLQEVVLLQKERTL